jgi:Zn-finger nucleic acid-binding protein
MKCKSCELEINPQWKHAIETNICPFCGQSIMDAKLKDLLGLLQTTLDELKEYPDELNDWMLSNHNFIKTDSTLLPNYLPEDYVRPRRKQPEVEGQKYTVKVKTESGEEEVVAEKIQSEKTTNEFFKRAEVLRKRDNVGSVSEKTNRIRAMAQQIKNGGGEMLLDDEEDPNIIEQAQSYVENQTSEGTDDYNDPIPAEVLAMAQKAGGNTNGADLIKLQQMQDRIYNSRKNFTEGSSGAFSRSG